MSKSNLAVAIFVFMSMCSVVSFAGDTAMAQFTNQLMAEGITDLEIIRIKGLPEWPSYDLMTGDLMTGDQRWIAPDMRFAYIHTVTNTPDGQRITKRRLFDYTKK